MNFFHIHSKYFVLGGCGVWRGGAGWRGGGGGGRRGRWMDRHTDQKNRFAPFGCGGGGVCGWVGGSGLSDF